MIFIALAICTAGTAATAITLGVLGFRAFRLWLERDEGLNRGHVAQVPELAAKVEQLGRDQAALKLQLDMGKRR